MEAILITCSLSPNSGHMVIIKDVAFMLMLLTRCPRLVPSEVEVDMVGEVDRGGRGDHGGELQPQPALAVQAVHHIVEDVSRVSLIPVPVNK